MHITRAMIAALALAAAAPAAAQTRIGTINTNFRWLGPDDRIVVERYDDPQVANVSCYMSRAQTGGIKGGLGFAEDPSRFLDRLPGRRAGDHIRRQPAEDRRWSGLPPPACFSRPSKFTAWSTPDKACAGLHRGQHEADQRLAVSTAISAIATAPGTSGAAP